MNEMLDEQLLRRALTAYADCRAPARRVTRSPVRSLRFGVVLAFGALVIAGSAVAAQRVVLHQKKTRSIPIPPLTNARDAEQHSQFSSRITSLTPPFTLGTKHV